MAVSLQPPPPFLHCVFPMHLVFSSSISRTIVLRFRACPIPGLSHLEISTLIKFAKIPFPRKTTFTSCRKTYLLGITIPPISYAGPACRTLERVHFATWGTYGHLWCHKNGSSVRTCCRTQFWEEVGEKQYFAPLELNLCPRIQNCVLFMTLKAIAKKFQHSDFPKEISTS